MPKVSLKQVGEDLAVNNYEFTPIRRNEKRPLFNEWTNKDFLSDYQDWISRHGDCGAGILTADTPAVDLDIRDEDLVVYMSDYVELCIGSAPIRVGLAPKRLLVFRRSGKKFPTMKSVWINDEGIKQEVQILGNGQQFIAYGVHPDTGKPYEWIDNGDPTTVDSGDLPELNEAQAFEVLDEFDRQCAERGWTHKVWHRGSTADYDEDPDAEFEDDDSMNLAYDQSRTYQGDYDELERKVMLLPNAEDYAQWVKVLAALQTGIEDQDKAYDIALKWSAQANNFDQDSFDEKWSGGFKHEKSRLVSFRSLLAEAHDVEETQRAKALESIIPTFVEAKTREEWLHAAATFRKTEIFGLARQDATTVAADRYKALTGRKLTPSEVKKNLAYRIDPANLPGWLAPWVFNTASGEFLNIRNGATMKERSFALAMKRYVNNSEDAESDPVKLATEIFVIPTVEGVMYHPNMHGNLENSDWKGVRECGNRPEFFRFFESDNLSYSPENGRVFLNSFKPDTLVEKPAELSKRDRKNISVIKDFFAVQFPNEREREYVMEYLAWCVKNPGRRINYALIIHGCPGSGKTILSEMLRCILGDANVGGVSNSDLQSNFTKWAEGDIIKFVEEVSVVGHGYDVLNNIKDKITNPKISVRRMHQDSLTVQNTASYIMVTNDPSALPIDSQDRRYLVVASQFQDKERDLLPFLKEEPNFFKRFDRAFRQSAGALRKWFSDYKFRKEFDPNGGHAPLDTEARSRMIDMSKDDFTDTMMGAIKDGDCKSVTPEIIFMPEFMSYLERIIPNFKAPFGRNLARKLEAVGLYRVGKTSSASQLRFDGMKGRCYAHDPRMWETMDGSVDADKIRSHLEAYNVKFKHEEDDWEENDML
jgi:hypothetical protein